MLFILTASSICYLLIQLSLTCYTAIYLCCSVVFVFLKYTTSSFAGDTQNDLSLVCPLIASPKDNFFPQKGRLRRGSREPFTSLNQSFSNLNHIFTQNPKLLPQTNAFPVALTLFSIGLKNFKKNFKKKPKPKIQLISLSPLQEKSLDTR